MSIASDLIRGHTETIILANLLNGDSYGYKINKAILKKTDGKYELKEATLYTAFRRLEESGSITSYWGDENSGARRRYYSITPEGRAEYDKLKSEWEKTKLLIDKLLVNGGNIDE
ncbi:MAG: PadR family transcriptional regulator [Eubacteriales bacterium]|nr:PadR family transcriptional regulator [Eubacteriales bacterium]MDD4422118.1 PadR family transcriptional regulator [Eubacteriales bacterium]